MRDLHQIEKKMSIAEVCVGIAILTLVVGGSVLLLEQQARELEKTDSDWRIAREIKRERRFTL